MFPLFVRAVGVITSIIGILAVTPRSETEHGMKAINRGFFISAAVSAIAVFVLADIYLGSFKPAIAVLIGLILASAFSVIVVYAQELLPGRVGMIAGLFFGLAFGISGIGAALLGASRQAGGRPAEGDLHSLAPVDPDAPARHPGTVSLLRAVQSRLCHERQLLVHQCAGALPWWPR